MVEETQEKVSSLTLREYNPSEDLRAELKRVVAKIARRKVTGTLTVDLGAGGINRIRLLETSERTE
jgi:hypothetical protein